MNSSAAHALLVEAVIVILTASLAGIVIPSGRRLLVALGALVGGGAAVIVVISRGGTLPSVALSQATLGTAAFAMAAIGRFCRAAFEDVLDATACSLVLTVALTFGILVMGPPAGDLPTPVVNLALAASPLVATSSAAHVDVLRSEPLYHLSPIAHRRFEYPQWYSASALYASIAAAGFFAASRARRRAPASPVSTLC